MRFRCLHFLILFLFCFKIGLSQSFEKDTLKVIEIPEVIVTGTRTTRALSTLPFSATVIAKNKIDQSGSVRINDILQEQTGIITVADQSGFEGIQIQGVSADYILILLDGVPLVGRRSGNFDLSRLSVGNINQIEVVKGPLSSLYGSEALGGVINIITEKKESKRLEGNTSYRAGSLNENEINLNITQGFKKLRYGFFANRYSNNGYDLNPDVAGKTVNPFENYTVNGKLNYDFSEKLKLFNSIRFYSQLQDAEVLLDGVNYNGNSEENEFNIHSRLDHQWNSKFTTAYEFYFTNYKTKESFTDPNSNARLNDSYFDQKLFKPEFRGTYSFDNESTLVSGIGMQYDALDRTYFDQSVAFTSYYIYSQYDFKPTEKLNVIIGGRFDSHSEYSNQLSPKFSARYKINDFIAVKSSIGYGFKAPDFRQLYFDFTNSSVGYTVLGYNVAIDKLNQLQESGQIINTLVPESELQTLLKAESSIGYSLGLNFQKKGWSTELNFFRNDFTNLIDTRVIARKTNGQNVFSYVNYDAIYTQGLGFNTRYKFSENLRISGGYQLLFAYDKLARERSKQGAFFARDPQTNSSVELASSDYFGLLNRSRHTANLKCFYEIPTSAININLRMLYRSKFFQIDSNGNGIADTYDSNVNGYVVTNFSATKNFKKTFSLQIGADNLFNYTDKNIPTLPGTTQYIKINYQF